jgi:hypothetical protein
VISDQARQRTEKSFRQEERARDRRQTMTEYEAQAHAIREKTARLKALRLAKEAQAQAESRCQSNSSGAPRAAGNNSSLNFAALRQSHAAN